MAKIDGPRLVTHGDPNRLYETEIGNSWIEAWMKTHSNAAPDNDLSITLGDLNKCYNSLDKKGQRYIYDHSEAKAQVKAKYANNNADDDTLYLSQDCFFRETPLPPPVLEYVKINQNWIDININKNTGWSWDVGNDPENHNYKLIFEKDYKDFYKFGDYKNNTSNIQVDIIAYIQSLANSNNSYVLTDYYTMDILQSDHIIAENGMTDENMDPNKIYTGTIMPGITITPPNNESDQDGIIVLSYKYYSDTNKNPAKLLCNIEIKLIIHRSSFIEFSDNNFVLENTQNDWNGNKIITITSCGKLNFVGFGTTDQECRPKSLGGLGYLTYEPEPADNINGFVGEEYPVGSHIFKYNMTININDTIKNTNKFSNKKFTIQFRNEEGVSESLLGTFTNNYDSISFISMKPEEITIYKSDILDPAIHRHLIHIKLKSNSMISGMKEIISKEYINWFYFSHEYADWDNESSHIIKSDITIGIKDNANVNDLPIGNCDIHYDIIAENENGEILEIPAIVHYIDDSNMTVDPVDPITWLYDIDNQLAKKRTIVYKFDNIIISEDTNTSDWTDCNNNGILANINGKEITMKYSPKVGSEQTGTGVYKMPLKNNLGGKVNINIELKSHLSFVDQTAPGTSEDNPIIFKNLGENIPQTIQFLSSSNITATCDDSSYGSSGINIETKPTGTKGTKEAIISYTYNGTIGKTKDYIINIKNLDGEMLNIYIRIENPIIDFDYKHPGDEGTSENNPIEFTIGIKSSKSVYFKSTNVNDSIGVIKNPFDLDYKSEGNNGELEFIITYDPAKYTTQPTPGDYIMIAVNNKGIQKNIYIKFNPGEYLEYLDPYAPGTSENNSNEFIININRHHQTLSIGFNSSSDITIMEHTHTYPEGASSWAAQGLIFNIENRGDRDRLVTINYETENATETPVEGLYTAKVYNSAGEKLAKTIYIRLVKDSVPPTPEPTPGLKFTNPDGPGTSSSKPIECIYGEDSYNSISFESSTPISFDSNDALNNSLGPDFMISVLTGSNNVEINYMPSYAGVFTDPGDYKIRIKNKTNNSLFIYIKIIDNNPEPPIPEPGSNNVSFEIAPTDGRNVGEDSEDIVISTSSSTWASTDIIIVLDLSGRTIELRGSYDDSGIQGNARQDIILPGLDHINSIRIGTSQNLWEISEGDVAFQFVVSVNGVETKVNPHEGFYDDGSSEVIYENIGIEIPTGGAEVKFKNFILRHQQSVYK